MRRLQQNPEKDAALPDTSKDILLTTEELADRWKVSAKSLANARSASNSPVPFVKIGNRVRYRLREVRALEQRNLTSEAGR